MLALALTQNLTLTPPNLRELFEAAIDGIVRKLDPYSGYIHEEDVDDFRTSVESRFGGIGIRVSFQNNKLQIISPLVGTPAYRAGLRANDVIEKKLDALEAELDADVAEASSDG